MNSSPLKSLSSALSTTRGSPLMLCPAYTQQVESISLLGIYLNKNILWKDACTHILIAAVFRPVKTWKQPNCPPTDEWIKMTWYICKGDGILLGHRKEWKNSICSNMDEPRDEHTKWSKSDRERQIPYDITSMWNLKYGTNEPIYKTDTENRLVVEGRMDWELGISRCKLLYIRWIDNNVLLYSTGNYIQCRVLNQNGKNMKNNTYMCNE